MENKRRFPGMLTLITAVLATTLAMPTGLGASAPPIPPDAAVVVNSGSTNTLGYRIVVRPNGAASLLEAGSVKQAQLPSATARAFFRDLSSAAPLRALGVTGCMKSASFGTTTRIVWHGQSTPDLTCPSANAAVQRLSHDVGAIGARFSNPRLHTLPVRRRHLMSP